MKLLMFYRQPENILHLFPLPNRILDILYFPCSNWLLVSSSFCPTLKRTCLDQQTTAGFLLTDTQTKCLNRALFICLFKIVTFQISPCSQNVCVGHCAQRRGSAYLTFLPRLSCSQKHNVGLWHTATASCWVLPWRKLYFAVLRKDPPTAPHTEIQPSSWEQWRGWHLNIGLGPSAKALVLFIL